ncbi:Rieske (2Fe-2S) protein [Tepidimonas charontis]|nr:Rieske (2Fe-2S) protein [Tepidimonas charontis]
MVATPHKADGPDGHDEAWHVLCRSSDLSDGGDAVSFDVRYRGVACRAFAIRFHGQVYAYLNRCSHVALELDWMPNRFFDVTGQWLVCAAHGALFDPRSGRCVGGPGRGPLVTIGVREDGGVVWWRSQVDVQPLLF